MAENDRARTEAGQLLESVLAEIPGCIEELFTPEKYPGLLKVMAQFHSRSFQNAVLIAAQCRKDRMFLAGRRTWERKYSRRVKSGEKGIRMILPVPVREKHAGTVTVPQFRVVNVYDLSQTDGAAALGFPAPELSGNAGSFRVFMDAVSAVSPVPLHFADIGENAGGYTYNTDGEIVIQDGMDEAGTMKAAVQAVIRAVYYEMEDTAGTRYGKVQADREMEIKSAVYMTCHYFELETSGIRFPDVESWRRGMDMDELYVSMDAARKLASAVIFSIAEGMRLQNMRETGLETDLCMDAAAQEAGAGQAGDAGTDDRTGVYKLADRMITVEPAEEGCMYFTYDSSYNLVGGGFSERLTAWETAQDVERHLKGRLYDINTKQYARSYEQGHIAGSDSLLEMDADEFRNGLKAAEMDTDTHKVTQRTFDLKIDGYRGCWHTVERKEVCGKTFYLMEHNTRWDSIANTIVSADGNLAAEGMGRVFDEAALAAVMEYMADGAVKSGRAVCRMEYKENTDEGSAQENQKPSPVSDMKTPEASLHNFSRAEIEETVYSYAQAAAAGAGLAEEVEIIAVRVYGSRCREGLYTENSDLDVVVSYSGCIREDDFFNLLNGDGFQIAGISVDINPVSTEQTGTLEKFLEQAALYLDRKELQMKAAGIITEHGQQEEKISFYVAECMEFPVMGEFHGNLTLDAAVELYHKIPAGRMDGEKGIGFQLENSTGIYSGRLLAGAEIQREYVSRNPQLKDSLLVLQAVLELEKTFPARGQNETGMQPVADAERQGKVILQEMDTGTGQRAGPAGQERAHQHREIKEMGNSDVKNAGCAIKPENGAQGCTGRKQSVLKALRERQKRLQDAPEKEARTNMKGEQEL